MTAEHDEHGTNSGAHKQEDKHKANKECDWRAQARIQGGDLNNSGIAQQCLQAVYRELGIQQGMQGPWGDAASNLPQGRSWPV